MAACTFFFFLLDRERGERERERERRERRASFNTPLHTSQQWEGISSCFLSSFTHHPQQVPSFLPHQCLSGKSLLSILSNAGCRKT
jgi:hypothetical protein